MKKKIRGKIKLSFELGMPKELKMIKFSFEKVLEEMKEHLPFMLWILKRLIIPLIPLLIIANFFLKLEIIPVIIIAIAPFIYGNFVPDFDSLMKLSKHKNSPISNKLFLLLFSPIYIYYFVFENSKSVFTTKEKEFHSIKYLLAYSMFLFFMSFLVFSYNDIYKHFIFSFFGSLGYMTHLLIDKKLNF